MEVSVDPSTKTTCSSPRVRRHSQPDLKQESPVPKFGFGSRGPNGKSLRQRRGSVVCLSSQPPSDKSLSDQVADWKW